MARPPRRSGHGGKERRRRRRRLYIVTKHYGDEGSRIYKLNENDFDSDDAYCEHSEDSDSSSSSEHSGYTSSSDSCFASSDDTEDLASRSASDNDSEHSGAATFSSDSGGTTFSKEQDVFDSEYDVDSRAHRLRHRRLVVRLGKQGGGRPEFLAAGTKIIGLNPSSYRATDVSFAFDAATRVVSAAPPLQSPKKSATFWTAGGAIYALDLNRRAGVSQEERCVFERLGPETPPRGRRHGGTWRWEALPPPPPFTGNNDLYHELESHAVHPDGATVFLSFDGGAGTFSFDGESLEWARHGGWLLPFDGEGFYVRSLDAWVGLCKLHRGRLAACPVVEGRRGGDEPIRSKCGKDLLFRHMWRRHFDANLVYKGNSEFCLLETVTGEQKSDTGTSCRILLRVVTFRVQYSFDGELCVLDRRSRVYELPPHSSGQKPVAFWV